MTPKRVAILISGRGSNMMSLVEHAKNYEVVLVASDRPDAPGLGWAQARGIAAFTDNVRAVGRSAWERQLIERIALADADVVALAGYMRILSPDFVARLRGNIVNIHPSLLPKYKGLDTHARAIEAGETEAGCSVHLVTEELDAGAVLGQARIPIMPGDTPETLSARVLIEEHRLYPRVLAEWCAQ